MSEFVHQLGIDWRLLLSQSVNFLLLLTILRLFAYKPLVKLMKERREKIAEGVTKAKEAEERLEEAQNIVKEKVKEAEHAALGVMKDTEEKAKKVEARLMDEARKKEAAIIKSAEILAGQKQAEARKRVEQEAAHLVREAIVKTVELSPEKVDEALIKKALQQVQK